MSAIGRRGGIRIGGTASNGVRGRGRSGGESGAPASSLTDEWVIVRDSTSAGSREGVGANQRRPTGLNYALFELSELIGFNSSQSEHKETHSASLPDVSAINTASSVYDDTSIYSVASGGHGNSSIIALYLSNDSFIFRYSPDSNTVPSVRVLPWFKQRPRTIVAMDFNPTAQWLVGVTADMTVILIPIYYLMVHGRGEGFVSGSFDEINLDLGKIWEANPNDSWFNFKKNAPAKPKKMKSDLGSFSDITVIRTALHSNPTPVSHCRWWRTWGGKDYVIITSMSGSIRFLDLHSHVVRKVKVKFPIVRFDLMADDSGKDLKFLVISTRGGGYFRLLIELRSSGDSYQTIITSPNHEAFKLTPLARFSKNGIRLSLQSNRGTPYLGAVTGDTLELYDITMPKYQKPVYTYRLFVPSKSKLLFVSVGEKTLFLLTREEEGFTFTVLSKLLATSANAGSDIVLQEFAFGSSFKPRGYFHTNLGQGSSTAIRPSFALESDDVILAPQHGFFIWTKHGLYEVSAKDMPEKIFFDLIAAAKLKQAEVIGKTFDLHMLRLYELAGDQFFADGQYGRALEIYHNSDIDIHKFLSKFLQIDRTDIVITKLRSQLRRPDKLSKFDCKILSTLLMKLYLQRYLKSNDKNNLHAFEEFLASNSDYSVSEASELCLVHNLSRAYLQVAVARGIVERALQTLIKVKGANWLNAADVKFLLKNDMGEKIKARSDRSIMSLLSPDEQIKLYMSDFSTLSYHLRDIVKLFPALSDAALREFIAAIDPHTSTVNDILSAPRASRQRAFSRRRSLDVDRRGSLELTPLKAPRYSRGVYIELFLQGFLELRARSAATSSSPQPKSSTSPPLSPASPKSHRSPSLVKKETGGTRNSKETPTKRKGKRNLIRKVASGWEHSLCLTSEGRVYSWGHNNMGQLGIGDNEDRDVLCLVRALAGVTVVAIAAGGLHSIAVDASGRVYTWGSNIYGQLGHGDHMSISEPKLVSSFGGKTVSTIACGYNFTVASTDDGLYGWGDGTMGQIPGDAPVPTPVKIPSRVRVKAISCGYLHTILLSEDGLVYSFGHNQFGQLGLGNSTRSSVPKLVSSLSKTTVVSVSCGDFHCVVVTDLHNVYSWGTAKAGRLGYMPNSRRQKTPKVVDDLRDRGCKEVSCGHAHSVVLTENGEVYQFGDINLENRKETLSALNESDSTKQTNSPTSSSLEAKTPVDTTTTLSNSYGGSSPNSRASLEGLLGNLDCGASPSSSSPSLLVLPDGVRFQSLSCGESMIVGLSVSGQLYSMGINRFGELGQGPVESIPTPTLIPDSHFTTHSRSPLLLSLPGTDGPVTFDTSQESLLSRLHEEFTHCTPAHLLTLCLQYENWEAVSLVQGLMGDWSSAFQSRCHDLSQRQQLSKEKLAQEVLTFFGSLMKGPLTSPNVSGKDRIVFELLSYWHTAGLAVVTLEDFLFKHITLFAPILSTIIQESDTSQENPLLVSFSPRLSEELMRRSLSLIMAPSAPAESHSAPTDALGQMLKNMRTRVDLHTRIVSDAHTFRAAGSQKVVLFSCGHHVPHSTLLDDLIPRLQRALHSHSSELTIFSKAILAEYHQNVFNAACPRCFYANFNLTYCHSTLPPWE